MAHFAQLDENKKVIQVIVVNDDVIIDENGLESEEIGINFCKSLIDGVWLQTSYNHKIRGKYAGIGDTYNEEEDIFIAPQPWPSWTRLGSGWIPPIPYPSDGKFYQWNELQVRWDEV